MMRFGLHLTLRTGREALTRLLVTAGAVAIGVSLLLCVLALSNGYQAVVARSCWECTGSPQTVPEPSARLLWRYLADSYQGKMIQRVDVASLASTTPVVPGLARMPAPGQYYASPALAALLATAPADELGDRFPGTLAGTIGAGGLTSPDELAIVIGRSKTDLESLPGTRPISDIVSTPHDYSTSQFYRFGFAMGAVALLIPMLILIGTATRLAAARREERYAALRLVGATRTQIGLIASVDAVLGGLLGALVGVGGYAALHPLLTHLALTGSRFFPGDIKPDAAEYAAVLIGVPLVAAVASVVSLYRVHISPLGVVRRVTPRPPRLWRLILLAVGLPLYCIPLLTNAQAQRQHPGPAMLSLAVIIVGLVVAGPWMTMQAARVLGRGARSGSAVLAARRLADNPRAAYRPVSGLVLAVMVGTALATVASAAIAAQQTDVDSQLSNVLRTQFVEHPDCDLGCGKPAVRGLPPAMASSLLSRLSALPGTGLIPMYVDGRNMLIRCTDLRRLPALGTCPAGAQAVLVDGPGLTNLFTDNLASLNKRLPYVTADTPITPDSPTGRNLGIALVTVDGPATLERARTLLSGYTIPLLDDIKAPQTFGEAPATRAALVLEAQRAVILVAGLTLLIAGCSLAVAVSGGIVERKRPFTLLRLTGTPVRTLYRVVLLETVLPLLSATAVAAAVGYTVALPVTHALAPNSHTTPLPDGSYYLIMGSGVVLAIAVLLSCLPILNRTTVTDNVRFE